MRGRVRKKEDKVVSKRIHKSVFFSSVVLLSAVPFVSKSQNNRGKKETYTLSSALKTHTDDNTQLH